MNPIAPFDASTKLLQKVMDLRSTKQRIIASNIANADTPGYNRKVFEFEDQLQQALSGSTKSLTITNSRHISNTPGSVAAVSGFVREIEDQTKIGDENSVNVDTEMIDLSKNELLYETAAQLLKKKFAMLSYVVREGK
jgi:flagellar basal-body rod protein FlgB